MPSAENPLPRKHYVFDVISTGFIVIFFQSLYSFFTLSSRKSEDREVFQIFLPAGGSVGQRTSTRLVRFWHVTDLNLFCLSAILFSSRQLLRRLYQSASIKIKVVQSWGYSHLPRNGGAHNSCTSMPPIASYQFEIWKIRKPLNSRGLGNWIK